MQNNGKGSDITHDKRPFESITEARLSAADKNNECGGRIWIATLTFMAVLLALPSAWKTGSGFLKALRWRTLIFLLRHLSESDVLGMTSVTYETRRLES